MEFGMAYLGMILLAAGAILVLWRRKRIFDRTNPFGIERFSSFRAKLEARTKDRLLSALSFFFLTAGLLILAKHFEDSWGWVVLLPVYAYLLFMLIGS